jgi:hypothetical protein
MEIDALLGAVVEMAADVRAPPQCESVLALVRQLGRARVATRISDNSKFAGYLLATDL